MSRDIDNTVRLCLRAIANDVAVQTGQTPQDVLRLFEVADYVSNLQKAQETGLLIAGPQLKQ